MSLFRNANAIIVSNPFLCYVPQHSDDHNMRGLIEEYKTEVFGCAVDARGGEESSSLLMPCDEIPEDELEIRFQQDPFVSFVVKAVSALTAAFRLVQLERCSENIEVACLRSVRGGDLHENILENLHKLSFASMMPSESHDGTQHHFSRNGRLVANKQLLYAIDSRGGLQSVGH